jgi:WD40 repeat protein
MAFSPSGQLLAAGIDDSVTLWNTTTGAAVGDFPRETLCSFAFSPNGQILAVSTTDDVTLWNVSTTQVYSKLNLNYPTAVAFSPDERFLACGMLDATVMLFNARHATARDFAMPSVNLLTFSADGSLLALQSHEKLDLWNVKTGEVHRSWDGPVPVVAFSPDGSLLVYSEGDSVLMFRNDNRFSDCVAMTGHLDYVRDIIFSPDSMIIATASDDKTVRLWAVEDGTERRVLYGHTNRVITVTFSSDGDFLASGSRDKTVRLWHVNSGAERGIFKGHSDVVVRVAFSTDGTLVSSASQDGTIRIWSPCTCEQLYVIHGFYNIMWLKFSADARILTTNHSAHRLPLLSLPASAADHSSASSYALAVQDQWLTCNVERLLWLPPQYRTDTVATHDRTIALKCKSGGFVVMVFDFSSGRPWEDMTGSRGAEC